MKKRKYILAIGILLSMTLIQSTYVGFRKPEHFPPPVYLFQNNPLTESKVTLGRALFYDPLLSKDNSISCASCHSPYNAFAHTDHDLSHGIGDSIGSRNAPALFNLAWQRTFMWDGAINHLDMQALAPISHPKEMGETITNVIEKLSKGERYPGLFKKAFSNDTITGARILKALSLFQLTLISASSKYDAVANGDEVFNEQEQNGYLLFKKNCNSCHTEPLFSSYTFAVNGLPLDSTLNDMGKSTITSLEKDRLKFKIPSLRNLTYTYPYMHDGRFKKLSQVLKHYTSLSGSTEHLDERLRNGIQLNKNEKADLISFLLTLNDKSFVFNPAHQFPKEILLGAKE